MKNVGENLQKSVLSWLFNIHRNVHLIRVNLYLIYTSVNLTKKEKGKCSWWVWVWLMLLRCTSSKWSKKRLYTKRLSNKCTVQCFPWDKMLRVYMCKFVDLHCNRLWLCNCQPDHSRREGVYFLRLRWERHDSRRRYEEWDCLIN